MKQDVDHYDGDCLQKLLDDTLLEPLATQVAEHIAECQDCRHQLETLAGEPHWWSRACSGVQAILAEPNAFSSSVTNAAAGHNAEQRRHSNGDSRSDHSLATDFAVDFLEPCHASGTIGQLGPYEIIEVIGSGGMGIVLKGYQRELNRFVAVKVLAPHLATSGAARRRFEREAQATAAVVHPHVMAIHAVAANAKLPYLVMPLTACESLQQRLDRSGPLDVKDILRIGMQAASGLAAAHAQGLVHRDVKPANILLETTVDRVMLTDFGLARAVDDATLTRSGVIAGTPIYMSPEQACGDAVDHRSDLFSLGSVLYAMCTGRPPFRAETTFGVLRRIRETSPRPIREINAEIPEWLERIVMKLLSKDAADRISTATEVASLLEQCLAHVQQPVTVALPRSSHLAPRDEPRVTTPTVSKRHFSIGRMLIKAHHAERDGYFVRTIIVTLLVAGAVAFTAWPRAKPVPIENEPGRTTSQSLALDPLLDWNATQTELDATIQAMESLDASAQHDLEGVEPNDEPKALE